MNAILEEILATGKVKTADGQSFALASHISSEQGIFLQRLIAENKASATLEVGLCYGVSALFICEAIANVPGAHHIVIDPFQFQNYGGIGLNNLKLAGYESLVESYIESSHIALPRLETLGVKIDFAFIDASHIFDYTLLDFFYIDRILRPGGIMVFDDASMPAVRKVLRFICKNRNYTVIDSLAPDVSRQKKFKYDLMKNVSAIAPMAQRLIKPEFLQPDIDFNLVPGARSIALRKDADDNRDWQFFKDF